MLRLIFFLFAVLSLPFLMGEWTRGFRLAKLQLDFPSHPRWNAPMNEEVASILSQPFHYLSKGSQSFVFASEDGRYVVKFFRFDRTQNPEQIFDACKLAFDFLGEETGLIYLHLNPTCELPLFRGKDPLGRSFSLSLDQTRFVLQKRARPFEEVFFSVKDQPLALKKRLHQFLALLEARTAKGIWNKDPSLTRNFGFLEERAIELDFGSYRSVADFDPLKEKQRYMRKLRRWLSKHAPEAVPYFEECVRQKERV